MTDSGTGYLRAKPRNRREVGDQLVDKAESGPGAEPRKLTFADCYLDNSCGPSTGDRVKPEGDPNEPYKTLPIYVFGDRDRPEGGANEETEEEAAETPAPRAEEPEEDPSEHEIFRRSAPDIEGNATTP
jgi:hypothetical protein